MARPYPASSTAFRMLSGPMTEGSYTTLAFSVARLTAASMTPGSFLMVSSTIPAQDAQVMPVTPKMTVLVEPGAGLGGGIGHTFSSHGSFTGGNSSDDL